MQRASRRWGVVGTGIALGCLFSGCTALTTVPPEASAGQRLIAFVGTMAGPFFATCFDSANLLTHSPVAIWQLLGFLSMPFIAAHPIKPSAATACVSIVGLAAWFWAGFLTVIVLWYGG